MLNFVSNIAKKLTKLLNFVSNITKKLTKLLNFYFKVRKSQDLGVPKSGQTTILIKVRNSQENGCQSQEKVRIFVFFATWKWILVKNGLTSIAVLFNLSST